LPKPLAAPAHTGIPAGGHSTGFLDGSLTAEKAEGLSVIGLPDGGWPSDIIALPVLIALAFPNPQSLQDDPAPHQLFVHVR